MTREPVGGHELANELTIGGALIILVAFVLFSIPPAHQRGKRWIQPLAWALVAVGFVMFSAGTVTL